MFYNNKRNPNFRMCLIVFKLHFLCVEAVQRALGPHCACRSAPGPSLEAASGRGAGEDCPCVAALLQHHMLWHVQLRVLSTQVLSWWLRVTIKSPLHCVLSYVWCFSEVLTVVKIGSLSLETRPVCSWWLSRAFPAAVRDSFALWSFVVDFSRLVTVTW